MTSYPGPVVQRDLLIKHLRGLRRSAGQSDADVATALGWPLSRLGRLENWAPDSPLEDLRLLLEHYGVEAAAKEGLFDLAGGSRMEGWWQHYVPYITDRAFLTYLSYEPGASLIMSFECLLIPGLLQTEAYARAILSDCLPRASTVQLDALVELRMERQRRLAEPNHDLRQVYILDEAALHRQTGSARVMAEQMNRLAGAGEDPSITVAVLPFNVTHMGRNGPFLVLESHYGIEDVLFLERVLDDAVLFGDSLAVADLRILFADLLEKALDTAQSKELIRRIAADLG